MGSSIVVGLDGSARQPAVLAAAVEMARWKDAELHVCRAMAVPVNLPNVLWSLSGDELVEFLVEHGTKELGRVADEITGLKVAVHCDIGQPAYVLCSLAERTGADLIVVGAHGYGGLDRVLGTTAAKVVNQSPVSVLVVRE